MRNFATIFIIFLLICTSKISKAAGVYSNDFETGSLGQIQNAQVIGTEGYRTYGFGNYYAWSDATKANAITLELNQLPEHSSLTIEFDLAAIDSWDGDSPWGPDYFNVKVDDSSVFKETFTNFTGRTQSYKGTSIVWRANLAKNHDWRDSAYHLSLTIFHTNEDTTISWFASGNGWEGGLNESYAIDNVSVAVNPVPIPAAIWLLGSGLLGLVAIRRSDKA